MKIRTFLLLVIGALVASGCTSPSKEGMQSSLKASMPVDAVITFE